MKIIDVEKIRFKFGDSWEVAEKWDDTRIFLDGIRKLNGEVDGEKISSKAVDVVGVRHNDLYLFEVKDFRGFAIETKNKPPHELPLSIARKARDTIAGLVGASRLAKAPWVERCAEVLLDRKQRKQKVHVIAWIRDPDLRPAMPEKKMKVMQKVRADRLRQYLSWLTPDVIEVSPFDGRYDVVAESLPGAGQR